MNVLLMAMAVSTIPPPACTWDKPGLNPFKPQNPVVALKDYAMDDKTRKSLTEKMSTQKYDDIVVIERDSVTSQKYQYSDLRDMHYGNNMLCYGPVIRTQWQQKDTQLGLVYCDGDTCVVVPTVCNNVSLITRKPLGSEDSIDLNPSAGFPPNSNLSSVTYFGESDFEKIPRIDNVPGSFNSLGISEGYSGGGFYPGYFGGGGYYGGGVYPPFIPVVVGAIPEPTIFWLMLLGLFPLFSFKRFKS